MRQQTKRRRAPRPRPDYLRLVETNKSVPEEESVEPDQEPPPSPSVFSRIQSIVTTVIQMTLALATLGIILWLYTRMPNH